MADTIQSMSESLLDSNSAMARGFFTSPSSIAWYITSKVTRALMSLQEEQLLLSDCVALYIFTCVYSAFGRD